MPQVVWYLVLLLGFVQHTLSYCINHGKRCPCFPAGGSVHGDISSIFPIITRAQLPSTTRTTAVVVPSYSPWPRLVHICSSVPSPRLPYSHFLNVR
ncbi:hypothetical protein LX36DRAFT_651740 [Colletotrichum falcatum]|nr:hypothetical protein LX36DRAFT_651740 [Colletotrichum falcatum]